jgi:hypothetical protein
MSAAARNRLSDDDLREIVGLLTGADSVELKLTVAESEQRSAVEILEMDPLEAEIRQVYFFDVPDLELFRHGVVVRARRMQRKGGDSVVKLRPVVPAELREQMGSSPGLLVELDAMPGGYVCSATLKRSLEGTDVKQVARGERPLRKLFSKQQRALFAAHAPDGVELDALEVLGPINVLKLKFSPTGYRRRMVAELWTYPDYTRILELSTKCAPGEAFDVAATTRAFLSGCGVDLSGEQETKTRKALMFFAAQVAQATAGSTSVDSPG